MKLEYDELGNGIRQIKLTGELDLTGTYGVEMEFVRRCAGENVRVLVDLSAVAYISSIGVNMLINAANSVAARGGKMVLLNPQQKVLDVLELTGILQIIPVHTDLVSAKAGLEA